METSPNHPLRTSALLGDDQERRLAELLASLTLEEKVSLLTGASMWESRELPRIGLRRIVFSDGPAGVRGPQWDEREPSVSLPSPTALAASWNPALVERLGHLVACEARAKNVDVVLGPTVNMQRTPRGGRHFEAFSEDPFLTGEIAAAYVRGLQDQGVGSSPKHFVANDSETDRHTVDVRVDERALHEVYLAPFQSLVESESPPWTVMSSYNSVNGVPMTENTLLTEPLKSSWGFDGIVVSDWSAVHDTVPAANAGQDLAMPGPVGVWGEQLVAAVHDGLVDEGRIDDKALRMLRLAARVGALDGFGGVVPAPLAEAEARELLTTAAAEGMVLAKNDASLPIPAAAGTRIAVIGDHARSGRTQGGGSARVFPPASATALEAIRTRYGTENVIFARGIRVGDAVNSLDTSVAFNPLTQTPGLSLRFFDAEGQVVLDQARLESDFIWVGDEFLNSITRVDVRTVFTAPSTGRYQIGFAGVGNFVFTVGGTVLHDGDFSPEGSDIFSVVFSPPKKTFEVEFAAGQEVEIELVHTPEMYPAIPMLRFAVTWDEPFDSPDLELERAVAAAVDADVAIVVVGTTEEDESEGRDRATLELPGRQRELIERVAAANERTVVVVNSGAPVTMPWVNDVPAVLLTWFPGQEFGAALADVLTGAREPGGRLPNTWPAQEADVPVWQVDPVEGRLVYAEGTSVGYREWNRRQALGGPAPALPFGHGLGYASWRIDDAVVRESPDDGTPTVVATVTNTSERRGKFVLQVYLSPVEPDSELPSLWLAGYGVARGEAGQTLEITAAVSALTTRRWGAAGWEPILEPLHVLAGTSTADLTVIGTLPVS